MCLRLNFACELWVLSFSPSVSLILWDSEAVLTLLSTAKRFIYAFAGALPNSLFSLSDLSFRISTNERSRLF